MPVVGHAFAGIVTAVATRSSRPVRFALSAWAALLTVFAYLPDIVGHGLYLAGVTGAPLWSHAVVIAVPGAAVVGACTGAVMRCSVRNTSALAMLSVLIHIALDQLTGTARAPWWPLYEVPIERYAPILPADPLGELALFGIVALVWLTGVRVRRQSHTSVRSIAAPAASRFHVAGLVAIVVIVAIAVTTSTLRLRRQSQFRNAIAHQAAGDYAGTLRLAKSSGQWPWAAGPGRVEYVMAEAYNAMGDRERAERYYAEAVRLDPSRFWPLVDLALFHAAGPGSTDERRLRIEPLMRVLRERFIDHPEFPRMMEKIAVLVVGAGAQTGDVDTRAPDPGR